MAVIAPAPAPPTGDPKTKAAVMPNSFTKASRRKVEPFYDETFTIGAGAKTIQQIDIPATGYLRSIVLDVTIADILAATWQADAPWNVLESIMLTDVNGQPLVILSGWHMFLADLFGGYTFYGDMSSLPGFTQAVTGATFQLRVPVEIVQRNALGSLANLNAAMTYKLKMSLAPESDVFTLGSGVGATVNVKAHVESWSNPLGSDLRGVPNQTTPPALGTTQNWSEYVTAVTVGQNTPRLPRVGNTIRNLVFEFRDATGARTDTGIPAELAVFIDGNQWTRESWNYKLQRMGELYGYGATRPDGVWVIPMTDDFDGTPGDEMGEYWLATSGATRLELQGTFSAAGSLTVLTNDILAFAGSGGAGQTQGS